MASWRQQIVLKSNEIVQKSNIKLVLVYNTLIAKTGNITRYGENQNAN